MIKPVVAVVAIVSGLVAQIDPTMAMEWSKLGAWGAITVGGGFLLKFTVKDLREDLRSIGNKLDKLIEISLRIKDVGTDIKKEL